MHRYSRVPIGVLRDRMPTKKATLRKIDLVVVGWECGVVVVTTVKGLKAV